MYIYFDIHSKHVIIHGKHKNVIIIIRIYFFVIRKKLNNF